MPANMPSRDPAIIPEPTLTWLPNELLLEVMGLVLEMGGKKDLSAFIRSCRAMYFLGIPLLVRELKFGELFWVPGKKVTQTWDWL